MQHGLRWLAPTFLVISALITFPACSKLFPSSSDVKIELPPGGNGGQGNTGPGNGGNPPAPGPGNGFNGGPPGIGQPGGPGWSGPGWGTGPGQPGNGFNPGVPGPGLGNGGELLQDEFYDPQLGVKFRCKAKQCFIQKFVEKNSAGGLARFGLKVFSSAGVASKQELFSFERIFELNQKRLGIVSYEHLLPLLLKSFPAQTWEASTRVNGIPGFFSRMRTTGMLTEELYAADEQNGLAKIRFTISSGQSDDAHLGYLILYSIIADLKAPMIDGLAFSSEKVVAGQTVSLQLSAVDDLTGVDLNWLYQEDPEKKLGDLDPAGFRSWIGYDVSHSPQAYSLAYAFPLVRRDADRLWRQGPDAKSFLYDLKVPAMMPPGRAVLAGLRVRDVYGHETRITLEPGSGNSYLPHYTVVEGTSRYLPALPLQIDSPSGQVPDTLAPRITRALLNMREIRQPEDNLCYSLEFQDEALARRLALDFTTDGSTKLSLPGQCLSESSASFTRDVGKLDVCFAMTPCFDQNRQSLLPKNIPIRLLNIAVFDENTHRGAMQGNATLPEFSVR